jgi:hypothetical protein
MIDVGPLSGYAPNCTAREGWRVLAFDPGGDHCATLNTFCRNHEKVKRIGLLRVNLEGAKLSVLREFCWKQIKPDVVLCKFADEQARLPEHRFSALADLLVAQGYQILVSE